MYALVSFFDAQPYSYFVASVTKDDLCFMQASILILIYCNSTEICIHFTFLAWAHAYLCIYSPQSVMLSISIHERPLIPLFYGQRPTQRSLDFDLASREVTGHSSTC